MHILIIPSWYPSNANDISGCFFREQAIALKESGCRVGVISVSFSSLLNWRNVLSPSLGQTYENDTGVETFRKQITNWFPRMPLAQSWLYKRKGMILFQNYIKKFGKPDIIHVHSMLYGGCVALNIYKKYNIPFVVTEHSTAFARGLVKPNAIKMAYGIANSAKKLFAVSHPFASLLDEKINSDNQWGVLHNIVQKTFFEEPIKQSKNNPFVFISIAGLAKKKNMHIALGAFAKAFKGDRNVFLRIGGEGVERSSLENLAVKLEINKQVKFLGLLKRKQVVEQMMLSDAFVLASRYETFGVVVVEALALGKPVIATRCGGPEDIVRERDGYLVPINDVDEMAKAMSKMVEKRDDFKSEEIRASCKARFDEKVISQSLIKSYERVLKNIEKNK